MRELLLDLVTPPQRPPDEFLVERRDLLDGAGITRALNRIAYEIIERNAGAEALALVGIRTGGQYLAERLCALIAKALGDGGEMPALGTVDITLYRDDAFDGLPRPEVGTTVLPFKLGGRTIVLVDDVLFTGRTVRSALDALMDFGRPRAVQLAVLVDRGHRELPVQADYVGLKVETTRDESIKVMLEERGGENRVVLRERERGQG